MGYTIYMFEFKLEDHQKFTTKEKGWGSERGMVKDHTFRIFFRAPFL